MASDQILTASHGAQTPWAVISAVTNSMDDELESTSVTHLGNCKL